MTEIFVFGSNLAGRHGAGAALDARNHHGAIYGRAVGFQGSSYGIPTKDARLNVLPLDVIAGYVRDFLIYAELWPELTFRVTRIGCGLAGYRDDQMAPLFRGATPNCLLPDEWRSFVQPNPP